MEKTRQSFVGQVSRVYEKSLKGLKEGNIDKEELQRSVEIMKNKHEKIKEKIKLFKNLVNLKEMYKQRRQEYKKKVKILLKVKEELDEMKEMNKKSKLIDYNLNLKVPADEILLYASKISNFIQGPSNYSTDQSQLLPCSFGLNKVENPEIESSGFYFMYKNNPHYEICPPPEIVYVNRSENNIQNFAQTGAFRFTLTVNGHLYLRVQVGNGEYFVYTTDGSIPNRPSLTDIQSDLISVNKTSMIRIRRFKPGMIDSPILEYDITVVDKDDGGDMQGFENMERPEEDHFQANDNDDNEQFDDLFGGAGFSSIHDQGVFSTPNNMFDSSFNTPIN